MRDSYGINSPITINSCDICNRHKRMRLYYMSSRNKYTSNEHVLRMNKSKKIYPPLPMIYTHPHTCTLGRLKEVEMMYKQKYIDKELYDEWMSSNGGEYQLGASGKLDYLWQDRLEDINNVNSRILYNKVDIYKNMIDNDKYKLFSSYVCKHHPGSFHIKVSRSSRLSRNAYKLLNKLFPFSSPGDKNKTTVDLTSLIYQCVHAGKIKEVNDAFRHIAIGTNNCTAVLIIMQRIGKFKDTSKLFSLIMKDRACCMNTKTFRSYMKACTTAIRRTSRWPDKSKASLSEITSNAYWYMSIGRSGMTSDWKQEEENRIRTKLPLKPANYRNRDDESNRAYVAELRPILRRIMNQLVTSKNSWSSFERYIEMRQMKVSSGSSGGEKTTCRGRTVRIQKRSAFSSIKKEDILKWLDSEPKVVANASEKFEAGNARAIYGTKNVDYFIMAYVIEDLERSFYNVDGILSGLTGEDEIRMVLKRKRIVSEDGIECTAIDFKDFNLQHTLEAQSAVFDTLGKRLRDIDAHEDAIKACDWCTQALLNQYVRFPRQNDYKKVSQGMFSGCRGTNFLNTILNLAYFLHAKEFSDNRLNLRPSNLYHIHQGDDVWITNGSRLWAMSIMAIMITEGFLFQSSKQIQDIQFCEFLRVIYTNEGCMGYAARTLSTFIVKPLQGDEYIDSIERSVAICKQIAILYRRGFNITSVRILWKASVPHALMSKIDDTDFVRVPEHIVKYGFSNNSYDIGLPYTFPNFSGSLPFKPNLVVQSPELRAAIPKHSAKDWANYMSRIIKDRFDYNAVVEALHDMNISDSVEPRDKVRSISAYHKDLKMWINKMKNCIEGMSGNRLDVKVEKYFQDVPTNSYYEEKIFDMKHNINTKRNIVDRDGLQTIVSAIRNSPFKELSLARKAFKMEGLGLLVATIATAPNQELRRKANLAIFDTLKFISIDVLMHLLDSVKGFGSSMEYILHPNLLSIANEWAIKVTLAFAERDHIQDPNILSQTILYEQKRAIKAMILDDEIRSLSKY
ncbi:hypothetical protein [Hubei toti-like virus 9]|uniref:hypothetical protein n=1 Tax=Hubei toti-like virus 9 TaxID=1923320 RepID=UPI0009095021|nr:hypothetical protein [Hubei toti-like virus 9]APG76020.1 hypothetical protein [Hubei toti-like virus 9]